MARQAAEAELRLVIYVPRVGFTDHAAALSPTELTNVSKHPWMIATYYSVRFDDEVTRPLLSPLAVVSARLQHEEMMSPIASGICLRATPAP